MPDLATESGARYSHMYISVSLLTGDKLFSIKPLQSFLAFCFPDVSPPSDEAFRYVTMVRMRIPFKANTSDCEPLRGKRERVKPTRGFMVCAYLVVSSHRQIPSVHGRYLRLHSYSTMIPFPLKCTTQNTTQNLSGPDLGDSTRTDHAPGCEVQSFYLKYTSARQVSGRRVRAASVHVQDTRLIVGRKRRLQNASCGVQQFQATEPCIVQRCTNTTTCIPSAELVGGLALTQVTSSVLLTSIA